MQSIKNAAKEREWCGPAARTLKKIYKCQSPESLFIEKAQELVRSSEIAGPPFDPFKYAKYLGIYVEESETMTLDGTVRQSEQGAFVICLKKHTDPPTRKYFTLAHEIAHTFFYKDLVKSQSYRGHATFDKEEEKLCNKAAAELLMPYSYFKTSLLKDGNIDPTTMLRIIEEYQVSLQAALIRAWEVTQNIACALWKLEGLTINLEWVTPKEFRGLILCQTGRSSVETAIANPDNVFTKRDSYYQLQPEGSKMIRRRTSSYKHPSSDSVLSIITIKNSP